MNFDASIAAIDETKECVFTPEQVNKALDKLALELNQDYQDKHPIILSVMVGGLIPTGNLLPRLSFPLALDYVHATRYRGDLEGKDLQWKALPTLSLKDRDVIIVDDILDGGVTLAGIKRYVLAQEARSVKTAVLIDKYTKRVPHGLEHADYVGLQVEDYYIFGYGLDYKEYLRNLPGIYKVSETS